MKFLPFANYTLKTALTADEIIATINENRDSTSVNPFASGAYQYKLMGYAFGDNTFELDVTYRNLPHVNIQGVIVQMDDGCEIPIKVRSSLVLLILMGILCMIFSFAALIFTLEAFKTHVFDKTVFVPYVMIIAFYSCLILDFNSNNSMGKERLTEMLGANILTKNSI